MAKGLADICPAKPRTASPAIMELVCQVDSLAALRSVVDNGADWVHFNVNTPTSGINRAALVKAIHYAHGMRCKVLLALGGQLQSSPWKSRREAIHHAAQSGVDAIISSDPAMLLYTAAHYPDLRLHFCMPDSAASMDSASFFHKQLGIKRLVMPRVSSLAQVKEMAKNTAMELEIPGFGKLSTIIDGRRTTSSHIGVEPPDEKVDRFSIELAASGDNAQEGYIDRCANAQNAVNESYYAIEDTPDINALKLLPQLMRMGVRAVKVEAQGYSPAYGARITRVWREAIDNCFENLQRYSVKPSWIAALNQPARKLSSG